MARIDGLSDRIYDQALARFERDNDKRDIDTPDICPCCGNSLCACPDCCTIIDPHDEACEGCEYIAECMDKYK